MQHNEAGAYRSIAPTFIIWINECYEYSPYSP